MAAQLAKLPFNLGAVREGKWWVLRSHSIQQVDGGIDLLLVFRRKPVDVVIDFTTPEAVLLNIEACVKAKKSMVVGTTGWYSELPTVRRMVKSNGIGFLYARNFSIGVNIFFDTVRSAAAALRHEYFGQIFERHHAQKKDAPSGTALAL